MMPPANMKQLSKAVLDQDHDRKMKAKLRNSSYEPWKNKLAKTKDTPFGGFTSGLKPKTDFDSSEKMHAYEPGQGSIDVSKNYSSNTLQC